VRRHAQLQHVIEAGRRGAEAKAEVLGQRVDDLRMRAQEFPVRRVDALLRGEGLHRLRRIGRLVEADAHHVEALRAEALVQRVHRLVQRARVGRADLEAAGVDEADEQRLAAVVGEALRAAGAIEQREVTDLAPERRLACTPGVGGV
jgi:hypothetical protein